MDGGCNTGKCVLVPVLVHASLHSCIFCFWEQCHCMLVQRQACVFVQFLLSARDASDALCPCNSQELLCQPQPVWSIVPACLDLLFGPFMNRLSCQSAQVLHTLQQLCGQCSVCESSMLPALLHALSKAFYQFCEACTVLLPSDLVMIVECLVVLMALRGGSAPRTHGGAAIEEPPASPTEIAVFAICIRLLRMVRELINFSKPFIDVA